MRWQLWSVNVFIALDANSSYWQIEQDEANIYRSAFVTHHILYRDLHLLFEVKHAPAIFQGEVKTNLATVEW